MRRILRKVGSSTCPVNRLDTWPTRGLSPQPASARPANRRALPLVVCTPREACLERYFSHPSGPVIGTTACADLPPTP